MVKLIVSDFDGTLMPYGRESLSEGVKECIQRALDRNITVAVSSGRTYGELASLLDEFTHRLWFICCDGAYYVHGKKSFCERKIEQSDLVQFFGMAQYVNRFANKGTALSDLQVRLMLTKYDTACIGDGGNDVVMMKNAKYSFAVGNRSSELVSAVTNCVDSAERAFDMLL